MSITIDKDNSILPNFGNSLSSDEKAETNNLTEENTNTTTIASDDPSFEEGDEDYDDEQEKIENKKEEKAEKDTEDSYLDYGGNNEDNAPAK